MAILEAVDACACEGIICRIGSGWNKPPVLLSGFNIETNIIRFVGKIRREGRQVHVACQREGFNLFQGIPLVFERLKVILVGFAVVLDIAMCIQTLVVS